MIEIEYIVNIVIGLSFFGGALFGLLICLFIYAVEETARKKRMRRRKLLCRSCQNTMKKVDGDEK